MSSIKDNKEDGDQEEVSHLVNIPLSLASKPLLMQTDSCFIVV